MRCERNRLDGVDEHDPLTASPAEELSGGAEPAAPIGWLDVEERLDVVGLHGRPVDLGSFGYEEAGEVPDEGDVSFKRRVGTGMGAGSAGTFTGSDEVLAEQAHGRLRLLGRGGRLGVAGVRQRGRGVLSRPNARSLPTEKSSRARANGPAERPGRRDRSSRAWDGWLRRW